MTVCSCEITRWPVLALFSFCIGVHVRLWAKRFRHASALVG